VSGEYLTVEDLREFVKLATENVPRPTSYWAPVHPRRYAHYLWLIDRKNEALWEWVRISFKFRLTDSEMWDDAPWRWQ